MRYGITLALSCMVFLSAACSTDSGTVHNRGIGIYPGDPAEDFSPSLRRGGPQRRNLALLRAATHSSSFDCNQTAQLVTDGTPDAWKKPWAATPGR